MSGTHVRLSASVSQHAKLCVSKKKSSLRMKQARFEKRIKTKTVKEPSDGELFSLEAQKEIEMQPCNMKCYAERKVNTYIATINFMRFEKKITPVFDSNSVGFKKMKQEMQNSKEGYFFYRNIFVGARKYSIVNKVKDDDDLATRILDEFGKDGMEKWIRYGFIVGS